jgi:hypothetical protein
MEVFVPPTLTVCRGSPARAGFGLGGLFSLDLPHNFSRQDGTRSRETVLLCLRHTDSRAICHLPSDSLTGTHFWGVAVLKEDNNKESDLRFDGRRTP